MLMDKDLLTQSSSLESCSINISQRQQNAIDAFASIRAAVAESGILEMSLEEINAEIKAVRDAGQPHQNG